jgi:hypothetical protein
VIGSLYVNGEGDSQLIINRDGCADGELRLMILNHDEGDSAHVVVDAVELLKIIKEAVQ